VVVVRGSKAGAHYAILETIASSSIGTQRLFCGGRGILFMRKIYADSELIGKPLPSLPYSDAKILLVRDEKIQHDQEGLLMQQGDSIVVFGKSEQTEEMQQWIYNL
jgi:trk system potassium uptake protein TrkA